MEIVNREVCWFKPLEIIDAKHHNTARSVFALFRGSRETLQMEHEDAFYFIFDSDQVWMVQKMDLNDKNTICFDKGRYLRHSFVGSKDLKGVSDALVEMKTYAVEKGFHLTDIPLIEVSSLKSLSIWGIENEVININIKIKS